MLELEPGALCTQGKQKDPSLSLLKTCVQADPEKIWTGNPPVSASQVVKIKNLDKIPPKIILMISVPKNIPILWYKMEYF